MKNKLLLLIVFLSCLGLGSEQSSPEPYKFYCEEKKQLMFNYSGVTYNSTGKREDCK